MDFGDVGDVVLKIVLPAFGGAAAAVGVVWRWLTGRIVAQEVRHDKAIADLAAKCTAENAAMLAQIGLVNEARIGSLTLALETVRADSQHLDATKGLTEAVKSFMERLSILMERLDAGARK